MWLGLRLLSIIELTNKTNAGLISAEEKECTNALGFKNKAKVALSNVTPDSSVAKQMLKQQPPRDSQ